MKIHRRTFLASAAALLAVGPASAAPSGLSLGELLHADHFWDGLGQWLLQAHRPGRVTAAGGVLDIDVPAGTSLWFRPRLSGPVAIRYEVLMVAEGGPNDRLSDMNAFWMANDPAAPDGDALARDRSGRFEDYDDLVLYYVGQGGNSNSTTRFRRYTGRVGDRPLLPENDRRLPADMLVGNVWQTVTLAAVGSRIRYWRDNRLLFDFEDPAPLTAGHFALRTTQSHLRVRNFRVHRAGYI
ncbi:Tat pathway signal sequence domain protein [Niveispirillum lacus]|uniref:Tat pathway signal sequence domain protein n=1 Tax=Niveispirillum lacus TaxID=1981099 RepID=A0A255YUG1_9PROT|nr:DUF6250 domain-containing protein [Niveispirillum lacus]OYQ32876.1 Tat pathway signal sequence domain protein [Niveispirillum lacus]